MTPLELRILLHYYCSGIDIDLMLNEQYQNGISMFIREGMMTDNPPLDDEPSYSITSKGKFYVEAILKVPFPVSTFVIPKSEESE